MRKFLFEGMVFLPILLIMFSFNWLELVKTVIIVGWFMFAITILRSIDEDEKREDEKR